MQKCRLFFEYKSKHSSGEFLRLVFQFLAGRWWFTGVHIEVHDTTKTVLKASRTDNNVYIIVSGDVQVQQTRCLVSDVTGYVAAH
jgi:hypothetical protein